MGDRMVQDAEANAEMDTKRKETVEAKNGAEQLVYQTETQLRELADKVPADLKAKIEPKLKALRDAIGQVDPNCERLEAMTRELREDLIKVGQAAYTSAGTSSSSDDLDEVVDVGQ